MAEYGLLTGWDRAVDGREKEATELFTEVHEYWGKQQAQGNVEGFESVFLTPYGGELNGFFLIRGEREKIDAVRWSDEFLALATRLAHVATKFSVIPVMLDEGVHKQLHRHKHHNVK